MRERKVSASTPLEERGHARDVGGQDQVERAVAHLLAEGLAAEDDLRAGAGVRFGAAGQQPVDAVPRLVEVGGVVLVLVVEQVHEHVGVAQRCLDEFLVAAVADPSHSHGSILLAVRPMPHGLRETRQHPIG